MTPLLHLENNLYFKAEYENPTGSVKDRPAQTILEAAPPNATVIEATSGNMGISLAALCQKKGLRCIIVMPDSMSKERQNMITSYGAELVLTPGKSGILAATERAADLAKTISDSFQPLQFDNVRNAQAHYCTTGPEIFVQTGGNIDIFVAGVGTGGTITGAGRYLKDRLPSLKIVAVEPAASPLLSTGNAGFHGIEGIGANFVPKTLDTTLFDQILTVTDRQALAATRVLNSRKIPAGLSSGANFHAARTLALTNPDKIIVSLLPDHINRYTSLGLSCDTN